MTPWWVMITCEVCHKNFVTNDKNWCWWVITSSFFFLVNLRQFKVTSTIMSFLHTCTPKWTRINCVTASVSPVISVSLPIVICLFGQSIKRCHKHESLLDSILLKISWDSVKIKVYSPDSVLCDKYNQGIKIEKN